MTLVNPNCRSENNNKKTEHTTDFLFSKKIGGDFPGKLTENDQEADQNSGQSTHAQSDDLALLVELAVLAQIAIRAVAQVERLTVDTHSTVETRVGKTFITVDAALAVQCHHLGLTTTFFRFSTKGFLFVLF